MFRGCQKKIIKLKNIGSGVFDEAYFILKDVAAESPYITETDMIKEANRIISENNLLKNNGKPPVKFPAIILWFTAGAITCGAAIAVLQWFII
ncbi:MAG: hypothetical protein ACYCWE_07700 [Eubacteriales bacterium]